MPTPNYNAIHTIFGNIGQYFCCNLQYPHQQNANPQLQCSANDIWQYFVVLGNICAIPCNIRHFFAILGNTLQYWAILCNIRQHFAILGNFFAILGNTLQHCIRTLPRGGMYWVVNPRRPRDFPRPERCPEGEARRTSRGPREILRSEVSIFEEKTVKC